MKVNLKEINQLVDKKFISVDKHPSLNISIYNYTDKCQYEKEWNQYTLMCRGLVLDEWGNIIARSFDKFFNLGEEYPDIETNQALLDLAGKHGSFTILEKYDGSLGIAFFYGNQWNFATRGSFISDQAVMAKRIIEENIREFKASTVHTHLFEIIYPENRIVVNYGDEEKLVYLASRNPRTGKYIYDAWCLDSFENARKYDSLEPERKNAEGYVLVFEDGYRVKLKFEEYIRLHKLITGLSLISIWSMAREGKALEDILKDVPDEFYKWCTKNYNGIMEGYFHIDKQARSEFDKVKNLLGDRKSFALAANKLSKRPSLLFCLLDSKEQLYKQNIFKIIRPKGNITFKVDES